MRSADFYYDARGAIAGLKRKSAVNIWDYPVKGDGIADDTAGFQAAVNAAGQYGQLDIPIGPFGLAAFKLTSTVTLPHFLCINGMTSKLQGIGYTNSKIRLMFQSLPTTSIGLSLGSQVTLRNVQIVGPGSNTGTAVGIDCQSYSPIFENVLVSSWAVGVNIYHGYYNYFKYLAVEHCGIGVQMDNCYNSTFIGCRFNMSGDPASTYGIAIKTTNASMISVIGCSIENYGTNGGITFDSAASISVRDTYFESAADNARGIYSASATGATVSVNNCQVYLYNNYAWVDFTNVTDGILIGKGNHFRCTSSVTPAVPRAYLWPATAISDIYLEGDNWKGVTVSGTVYAQNPSARTKVTYPKFYIATPRTYLQHSYGVPDGATLRTGRTTTAARPSASGEGQGSVSYDQTLSAPVWSDGTNWLDADGRSNYLRSLTGAGTQSIAVTDKTILLNGATTVGQLPAASSAVQGRIYVVKNINTAASSLTSAGGTIDGATSVALPQWASVSVASDGANWFIVAKV